MVHQDDARRSQNRANAIALARAGIPVFPSSGKVPLVKLYNRLDVSLGAEERAAAVEGAREEGNAQLTVFIGATTDVKTVERMWRAPNRDAVPSIPCGPAHLVVIDADTKFSGPELIAKLFEANGGVPEGTPIITTQSGGRHYVFSDPGGAFTNSAGLLKKNYGCDVRGRGGQFVAPGSWREDGKKYGDQAGLAAFITAYVKGTIPPLPDYIAELIGASSADMAVDIPIAKEREVIERLRQVEIPDWDELCAPIGDYDFAELLAENDKFRRLYQTPSNDCSANRFKAARHVMREWPNMPPAHLSSFFRSWEGAGSYVEGKPRSGEYDDRQIAREWQKNQRLSKSSIGAAFSTVDEVDEHDAFIANGGTEERWNVWQNRLALEREERLVRAERQRVPDDERENGTVDGDKPKGSQRSFIRGDEIVANYQPVRWLVKRLIPLNSVGALYGLPNVGKSFVVFDLANHVRRSREWFGRKVQGGDVLYCYAEGAEGMGGRAKAWADNNDSSGGDVALMNKVPNLFRDSKAAEKLIAAARECQSESGQPVRLIVVDTLAAATIGADGSSDKDMGVVLERLRTVAETLECAVLVVHHSGKDEKKGMRGSSAILGAVEYTLLAKEGKGASTLIAEKVRDAPKNQILEFKLMQVVIGEDDDGEDVTSCIVRPVEIGAALSPVEDEEEVPLLKVPDRKEDRVAMLLAVAREEAEKAAAEDEPASSVALTPATLREALNARRRQFCGLDGKPLTLLDRTGVKRVIDKAVEDGGFTERRGRVFVAD